MKRYLIAVSIISSALFGCKENSTQSNNSLNSDIFRQDSSGYIDHTVGHIINFNAAKKDERCYKKDSGDFEDISFYEAQLNMGSGTPETVYIPDFCKMDGITNFSYIFSKKNNRPDGKRMIIGIIFWDGHGDEPDLKVRDSNGRCN